MAFPAGPTGQLGARSYERSRTGTRQPGAQRRLSQQRHTGGKDCPALDLNCERLTEIFSHQNKTWVALNPLILPVGQELGLDLEPKGGRGQNQQRNLKLFIVVTQPGVMPRGSCVRGQCHRQASRLGPSSLPGPLVTTDQRLGAKLGGQEGVIASEALLPGYRAVGAHPYRPPRSRNNNMGSPRFTALPVTVTDTTCPSTWRRAPPPAERAGLSEGSDSERFLAIKPFQCRYVRCVFRRDAIAPLTESSTV